MHYPVIEKECFAIIYCLTKLRQYLLGADVTVYTDHAPLKSLFTAEMKNTRVQRWAILLDEYQVKIKYRQGIHNGRADMLSRIRIKPTADEIKESNEIIAIEEDQNKARMYEDILFDKDINMILSQRRDDYCKRIRRQLRDQVEKVIGEYTVQDNLLYRIGKENRFETEPFLQLVIPLELKNIILEGYHDCLGGGHVGIEKTYQKIRSRYFWKHCYKDVHPWALSQREQCTTAVTNLLPPLDNGLGALFHYLVIKGLTSDEIEQVARILDCMTTMEERYNNARPKGRHNVTREANRYVYALWRLKFPTLTEVSLSFSEGREAEITGFRSLIVDTWNSLDRVGQTLLLKNIKIYQLLVIHELGPLCHLLLSPHASDVLNTNYEETLVIER